MLSFVQARIGMPLKEVPAAIRSQWDAEVARGISPSPVFAIFGITGKSVGKLLGWCSALNERACFDLGAKVWIDNGRDWSRVLSATLHPSN